MSDPWDKRASLTTSKENVARSIIACCRLWSWLWTMSPEVGFHDIAVTRFHLLSALCRNCSLKKPLTGGLHSSDSITNCRLLFSNFSIHHTSGNHGRPSNSGVSPSNQVRPSTLRIGHHISNIEVLDPQQHQSPSRFVHRRTPRMPSLVESQPRRPLLL